MLYFIGCNTFFGVYNLLRLPILPSIFPVSPAYRFCPSVLSGSLLLFCFSGFLGPTALFSWQVWHHPSAEQVLCSMCVKFFRFWIFSSTAGSKSFLLFSEILHTSDRLNDKIFIWFVMLFSNFATLPLSLNQGFILICLTKVLSTTPICS